MVDLDITDPADVPADTSIGGSEKIPVADSTTAKYLTPLQLKTYNIDAIEAIAAGTVIDGDDQIYILDDTDSGLKPVDIDTVLQHIVDIVWAKTAETAVDAADILLLKDGGSTEKTVTAAILATYIQTAIRTNVLDVTDLTALTSAADANAFLIVDGSTPKQITFANILTSVYAGLDDYVIALDAITTSTSSDVFYCLQGSVEKKVTLATLSTFLGGVIPLDALVDAEAYTGSDGNICFVKALETVYRYEETGSAYTVNDTTILDTGDGGNTRWLGIAGQYPRLGGSVTAAAVMTDNTIITGDGGAKGVQDTGVSIDDSNNVTGVVGLTLSGNVTVTGTVDGRDVATDGTKLDTIEESADVTDAINVNAAGATMNTDADISANTWVIDENDMTSDLDTKVPTQQSVKAYVDAQAGGGGGEAIGTTWTTGTIGAITWRSVCYGNGLFVAVGENGAGVSNVTWSEDGKNWNATNGTADDDWRGVAFGNGMFVAVCDDGTTTSKVMTSPDGKTWTAGTCINNLWRGLCYGGELFVAVSSAASNKFQTSPDGFIWTGSTVSNGTDWTDVCYGNGIYVAVGKDGTKRVARSTDGATWTNSTAAEQNSWLGVCYGDGLFVAVSIDGTNRVQTSPDGTTWTSRSASSIHAWSKITYAEGYYIASTYDGYVMTSPDGTTWTDQSCDVLGWYDICYGDGMLVSIAGSAVMTSGEMNRHRVIMEEGVKSATLVTTVGTPGLDTNIASEKAVRSAIGAAGGGDVSAGAVMTDNTLIKGDGGVKGVQDSGITIDDSDNITGIANLTITGTLNDGIAQTTSAAPTADAQVANKKYVDDNGGSWDGDITDIDLDGGTDIGANLVDADLILVDDGAGGTNRKSAISRLWTYVTTKIQALSAKTTPIGADILTIQDTADSNNLKELTVTNLATNLPSGVVPIASLNIDGGTDIGADLVDADLIVVDDGAVGTNRKSVMSRVWTYITGKIQGLSAKATPLAADILTIQDTADSNNLKETTIAELQAVLKLDDFAATEDNTDLNATTSVHGLLPKLGGGTTNFLRADGTWATPAGGGGTAVWTDVSSSKWTATPTDTDTLAMSDTSDISRGFPIRYTIGGTVYYGQVSAVTTDTSIDVVGASLSADVTKLELGQSSLVVTVPIYIDSTYGDATNTDLIKNDMNSFLKWRQGKAYLVSFSCVQTGVDTGAEPKVNVQINNAAVSTNDTNNGVQLGAANTWVGNSAIAINTSNYDINWDEELEVACTVAGGTGDAKNLTVLCTFILEA